MSRSPSGGILVVVRVNAVGQSSMGSCQLLFSCVTGVAYSTLIGSHSKREGPKPLDPADIGFEKPRSVLNYDDRVDR